jgi:hypothetical protein
MTESLGPFGFAHEESLERHGREVYFIRPKKGLLAFVWRPSGGEYENSLAVQIMPDYECGLPIEQWARNFHDTIYIADSALHVIALIHHHLTSEVTIT